MYREMAVVFFFGNFFLDPQIRIFIFIVWGSERLNVTFVCVYLFSRITKERKTSRSFLSLFGVAFPFWL
jgi:hypothetical protein